MVQLLEKYCKEDAVCSLQRTCSLVTFYAENAGGGFRDHKEIGGGGQLEFSVTAIPASGKSLYTKLLIRTEKSSIECTMNDYNVQTPRKNPLHLQTSLFLFLVEKPCRYALFYL